MFVTTVVVGAVITASGGSVKAAGMFVRDIMFNLIGSTMLFFLCLSERATLYEAGILFGMYIVYVVAVTQGHRFPPMLRADREAWYAKKEVDAASVSEKAPLLSDKGIDNLRQSLSGNSAEALERERRASIQDGGVSPLPSTKEDAADDVRDELADESCCGSLQRRMAIASEWDELDGLERASFCFEAIMHFFRGLTIPVIPEDDELSGEKWNTAFQRLRAVCAIPGFFAWMTLYVERRIQDVESEPSLDDGSDLPSSSGPEFIFVGGMPISVFLLVITLPWCGVVWVLTENGMPRWLRQVFVLPAFISSIAWFDVGADELVEVLRAFGYILDLPIAVLGEHHARLMPLCLAAYSIQHTYDNLLRVSSTGVTVLAWGNSVSDLLACRAIAREGHAKMAISVSARFPGLHQQPRASHAPPAMSHCHRDVTASRSSTVSSAWLYLMLSSPCRRFLSLTPTAYL
jgi:Ca2+/Na+ antiporter